MERLIVASDCTTWHEHEKRYCGADARFIRLEPRSGKVVGVVCARHCRPGDRAVDATMERAPRAVNRKGVFLEERQSY